MSAGLFARAESALRAMPAGNAGKHGTAEQASFWVPGRIEFLGKHTDYAGGRSLICAVDRGIALVARRRDDTAVHVRDAVLGESCVVSLDPASPIEATGWGGYIAAVARRVARNFPGAATGVDIAFASDLPIAAGMSSSSALVIAVFLALDWANELARHEAFRRELPTVEALAGYLGSIESGRDFASLIGDLGVGTMSGSQDQTAILCGRAGSLVQYSFCPVRHEDTVPLPPGYVFAIASSGVRAEKSAGARERYNAVARRAAAAADLWRRGTGYSDATLGDVAARGADAIAQLRAIVRGAPSTTFTGDELLARVDQFVVETLEIIPATSEALARRNLGLVKRLVARSFAEADTGLGNQVPETRWLVAAIEDDAVAASAFGAGFGGSVWALVPEDTADTLLTRWRQGYAEAFPQHRAQAEFFVTSAGPPASRMG